MQCNLFFFFNIAAARTGIVKRLQMCDFDEYSDDLDDDRDPDYVLASAPDSDSNDLQSFVPDGLKTCSHSDNLSPHGTAF